MSDNNKDTLRRTLFPLFVLMAAIVVYQFLQTQVVVQLVKEVTHDHPTETGITSFGNYRQAIADVHFTPVDSILVEWAEFTTLESANVEITGEFILQGELYKFMCIFAGVELVGIVTQHNSSGEIFHHGVTSQIQS